MSYLSIIATTLSCATQQVNHSPGIQAGLTRGLALAFYYPWYGLDSWTNDKLRDHPTSPYDSSNLKVISENIQLAKKIGVDVFVSSWWGPNHLTDSNLRKILDIAQQENFKIAIHIESLDHEKPRKVSQMVEWIEYATKTYASHPALLKINQRPVLFVAATNLFSIQDWLEIRKKLSDDQLSPFLVAMDWRPEIVKESDALHWSYVLGLKDLKEANIRMRKLVNLSSERDRPLWIGTIQPGYDERSFPNRKGVFRDRKDGETFKETFEAALAGKPDWLLVVSWNEWWENTHIEQSKLYGRKYLDLTSSLIQKWKSSLATDRDR